MKASNAAQALRTARVIDATLKALTEQPQNFTERVRNLESRYILCAERIEQNAAQVGCTVADYVQRAAKAIDADSGLRFDALKLGNSNVLTAVLHGKHSSLYRDGAQMSTVEFKTDVHYGDAENVLDGLQRWQHAIRYLEDADAETLQVSLIISRSSYDPVLLFDLPLVRSQWERAQASGGKFAPVSMEHAAVLHRKFINVNGTALAEHPPYAVWVQRFGAISKFAERGITPACSQRSQKPTEQRLNAR